MFFGECKVDSFVLYKTRDEFVDCEALILFTEGQETWAHDKCLIEFRNT